MLNVSKEIKDYLAGTGRTFKAFLTLEGAEVGDEKVFSEEIMSLSVNSGVCAEKLSIGNVNSACLEAVIYGVDKAVQFSGKKVVCKIQAGDNQTKFSLGTFTAQKPTREAELLSFKAFDDLARAGSVIYFPSESLSESEEIDVVFADVCRCLDKAEECVPIYSSDFEGEKLHINPKKLSGMTVRNALGQIAGFLGGNIVCNSENKIEVKHFIVCDFETNEDMISTSEIAERVFALDGLNCTCGSDVISVGSQSGNILYFSNVLMTEEQLQAVFDELKIVSYRAMSLENLVGTFVVEAGDIITATVGGESLAVPVMQQSIDFDGGLMNSFESFCESEIEDGSLNLTDIPKEVEKLEEDIKSTNEKIDNTEGKVDETSKFAEMFSNALGLYKIVQTLSDGSTKIYYADKPELSEADYIIGLNAGGFAYAVSDENKKAWNNGNPNWKYGMDKDGNAIMKTIRANKITADEIDVDNLTSLGASLGGWNFNEQAIFKDTNFGSAQISILQDSTGGILDYLVPFISFVRKKDGNLDSYGFITYSGIARFNSLLIGNGEDFTSDKIRMANGDVECETVSIKNNVKITGENKVLWSGAEQMGNGARINLSQKVSEQLSGIVLVFSAFTTEAKNYQWQTFFVPKNLIASFDGMGQSIILGGVNGSKEAKENRCFSPVGMKYVYIYNDRITGHEVNTENGTQSGITYNSSKFVLRYVLGV